MEIIDILHQIGYTDLWDVGKTYRTKPLYRNSDNKTSLSITKNTGNWYDFSARVGGNLNQLIQLTTKTMTDDDIKKEFGDLKFGNQINGEHRVELTHVKKFDKELLPKLRRDHSYWLSRGVSQFTIEQFEGGTTDNGRMKNRYVFPIFDERDDLVGFSGRTLTNSDIKWKHLGRKTTWLYPLKWNASTIVALKQVIIVESIGDMLSLWDMSIFNIIVAFGVDVSAKIVEFCLKSDLNDIIIAFNNEPTNEFIGNKAALEAKEHLLNFFDEHQVRVGLPDAKDFGEMTKEQINLWKTKLQIKSL